METMKKRMHDGSLKDLENEPEPSEFEVFLSFRGEDSQQGLADVLYSDMTESGIRVFRDNDELDMGDNISKILPALKNSKICVPIFSETFAASPWCLREVEAMVEHGKTIIPVFYTASPEDVKLRTDLFREDLRKHEKKHGREQVKKWEDALRAIGRIVGREVKTTGSAEFSNLFVRALLIKLKVKRKYMPDFLVKRQEQEEAVMKLLDIDSGDVRLVGIHGMGGIGKTTLVKVIFNALSTKFDSCSFLENVRESLRYNNIEFLQRKLLEDLDPHLKVYPMINFAMAVRKRFCHRKVLIVLDDVNERKQVEMIGGALNWFGSGSRLIITTRDNRVFPKEAHAFEVQGMNQDEALQLFSRHAFRADSPPSGYETLSYEAISCTGRLPLALEIIGSLLQGCEKKRWKAAIEKSKKVLNQGIQENLKLSFDALEYEQKQIFLDISCFFINKETSSARYMWEACDLFPDEGIEVLVSMSLLKIEENKFGMHDLIRDLGRAIVREECADEPAQRSRIWSREEALEVLKVKKGKENVEGLFLEEHSGGGDLTNEQFSSLRKLRLLKLVDMKLTGDFENLLPKLKWFSWHRCPSDFTATNVSFGKLVVLDLSWSYISERWGGWSPIQMAKNLKVLNLTGCCNLRSTPDLSNNEALERLILKGCRELAEIHASIGKLKRLKHLDIKDCSSLRGLPERIGSLENLDEILLEGTSENFRIPDSVGNLRSLSLIKLHPSEITRTPRPVGEFFNLTQLHLKSSFGMTVLPDAIGELKSLVELDLSNTDVSALPSSIGRLAKLENLIMESTKIKDLPEAIGDLKSSLGFDLSSTKLRELPSWFGELDKLESLSLRCPKIEELPDSLGDLRSLEELELGESQLWVLPDSVRNLSKLKVLRLDGCKMRELPSSIGRLMEYLSASYDNVLTKLPFEIGNISTLRTASRAAKVPSTTDQLTSLSLGALTQLQELELDCLGFKCTAQLPPTLKTLILSHVTPKTELPDFSNLKDLQRIGFEDCSLTDVHKLESLGELKMLKHVTVRNCSKELVDFFRQLKNLSLVEIYTDDIDGAEVYNVGGNEAHTDDINEEMNQNMDAGSSCDMRPSGVSTNEKTEQKTEPKTVAGEERDVKKTSQEEEEKPILPMAQVMKYPAPSESGSASAMHHDADGKGSEPAGLIQPIHQAKLLESSGKGSEFLMQGGLGLVEPPEVSEWERAKEIYLMHNDLTELPESPRCLSLSALFLQRNGRLRTIPSSFFSHMPALEVLNLSGTCIKSLPDSLFQLVSLKRLFLNECVLLRTLPAKIGELKNLEVLDLGGTELKGLPKEIEQLVKLTCLEFSILGSTRCESSKEWVHLIPPGVLSSLPHIEELNVDVSVDAKWWDSCAEALVDEICSLEMLNTLKFYFPKVELMKHFGSSSLTRFRIVAGKHIGRIMSRLPLDVEFELERWDKYLKYVHGKGVLEDVTKVLKQADAFFLDRHVDVKKFSDFGRGNLEQLKCCVLGECNELQVLIDGKDFQGGDSITLSSLEYLCVYYMKSLETIWSGPVPKGSLSGLKSLTLRTCPKVTSIFTCELLENLCLLEELTAEKCPALVSLVSCNHSSHSEAPHCLPVLRKMSLHYLPGLTSISSGRQVAPKIEWLSFYNCPNVKSLDLPLQGVKRIRGEKIWWEGLEWNGGCPSKLDDVFVAISKTEVL